MPRYYLHREQTPNAGNTALSLKRGMPQWRGRRLAEAPKSVTIFSETFQYNVVNLRGTLSGLTTLDNLSHDKKNQYTNERRQGADKERKPGIQHEMKSI